MKENSYNLQTKESLRKRAKASLIIRHFKKYVFRLVILVLIILAINGLTNFLLPQLVKKAIDINIPAGDFTGLLHTSLIYLGLALLSIFFNYIRTNETGLLSQNILFNIRKEVFEKIQTLPTKFFSDNQTGDIIQRLTGNVEGIDQFFSQGLVRLMGIFFNILTLAIIMLLEDWRLGLVSVIGGILILIFLAVQGELIEKPIAQALKKEGGISANIQETMDGFVAIKADNQEDNWAKNFKERNLDYYQTSKKVAFLSSLSDGYLNTITLLGIGLTLILSIHYFTKAEITIGTVVIFFTYTQSFFRSFNGISDIWRSIKTGLASADRLQDVLDLENDIVTKEEDPYSPIEVQGDIKFVDVDFSYDNENKVLEDINLHAKAGETIAIVGPTGAGKTTFVNLIARLYDVDNGKILVDDHNVKDWNLDTLRESIGYLIQDTFLFEDTILNNLKYDNAKITEEEALETFEFLGAKNFIDSLEEGLNTKLTDKANNISSGQRQIVALARILLRKPKILILDEATARIDTKSEKMLQKAIEKATEGKTTFIIAHRLSTIFNADRIILISNNKILEQGTHKQLIERKGAYYEMYSKFVGNN